MNVLREIPNTNGNYFATDKGVIFTRPRRGSNGGELKQHLNGSGYLCVDLRIGGKKVKGLVHRLIALAFLDNPGNKPCVNHKDGNKANNSADNLEWCSYSENMKHAIAQGLNFVPALSGENHPMHKLTAENARQIRALYDGGAQCPVIAKNFHITKEQVYNIVKGIHWKNI